MEFMKDKINLLLLITTVILTGSIFFANDFLCGILLGVCAFIPLTAFVNRANKME